MIEYEGQPLADIVGANEVVLLQYYAEWCNPCQMLKPILEEIAKEMTDVKFYRVDIEKHRELAGQAGVQSIPTIVLYKNGTEVSRERGFKPKHLVEAWLNANK